MVKTSISIIPIKETGKKQCLILFADENAFEQKKSGKDIDNITFKTFKVEGDVESLEIELHNGTPAKVYACKS